MGFNLKDSGGSGNSVSSDAVPDAVAVSVGAGPDVLMNPEKEDSEKTVESSPNANSPGNIIIPGFVQLTFKGGAKEQNVHLYNPKDNNCYFIISILLADNTELFQSELLAPGSTLTKIKLSKTPEPGTYDAVLRYSCFDMETLKGLNGANTQFTLEVVP